MKAASKADIRATIEKFSKSRHSLLVLLGFSLVNLFLELFGFNLFFLFSSFTAMLLFIDFPVLSFVLLALYAACYLLAKSKRVFLLVALIIFAIDTLVFGIIMLEVVLMGFFELDILIYTAFYVFIIVSLVSGVVAWAKLRHISEEDLALAFDSTAPLSDTYELEATDLATEDDLNDDLDDEELDAELYQDGDDEDR